MKTATGNVVRQFDVLAVVAIALIVQTAISLLAASTPVLASEIAKERAWNVTLIAFYPTIVCITQFFISFQVPSLLRRFGGMGLSLVCIIFSASRLLCLLVPSLGIVAVAPFAIGLAAGSMNPASAQVLGPRTSSHTAGFIMSIKQTGVPLGGTLAGVLLPILVLHSGWQYTVLQVFLASVVLVVLLLPLVSWLNGPKTSIAVASYRPLEPAKRLVAIPGMRGLLLAGMPFSAMQICLRSFFVVYLVKDVGLSLETAGLAFSAAQAGGIVGQVVWATMSDRLLNVQTVMALVGILMTVAAVLTAAFTSDWPVIGVVAVAIVYGLTATGFFPIILGEVARRAPPGEAGALTGGTQLYLVPAAFVGPLVFGAIASSLGYAVAFLSLAACTLAGSGAVAMSRPATVGDASS